MKEVVSVSIGSSARDHAVEMDLLGERFHIRREGTDGRMDAAVRRIRALDGAVDAFGLGGIDLFLRAAGRDYHFRDAKRFAAAAKRTPIVDGSGLKGAVEASVVPYLRDDLGLAMEGKRVLMTSAVDRWGMAEAFWAAGCEMTCADMLCALGIDIKLRDRVTTERFVRSLMPVVRHLPFKWLYPAEADHTSEVLADGKYAQMYRDADIIAGDYKYVRKWMPDDMRGKWVVTNTTTAEDVAFLHERGVELLVTSTPRIHGRSFGANVVEATLVALDGSKAALGPDRYAELLRAVGFRPDVQWLQQDGRRG